jgi:Lrp/AsnC family transcriptional regulator, leucine-responsive regulatory protein
MKELSLRERQVLSGLLKNAKISDQALAREIGTSRPTIIKIRKRLEDSGLITQYTTNVNFEKIGFHINATTFFRWDDFSRKKELQKLIKYVINLPQVIRFGSGQGIGSMTHLIVSLHKDLNSYEKFWQGLQEQGGPDITEVQVFLSTIKGMRKTFDLASPIIHNLETGKELMK